MPKGKIESTAEALGGRMANLAGAAGKRAGAAAARAKRVASGSLRRFPARRLEPAASTAATLGNALLATNLAAELDRWTRSAFASGGASPYDKVLDAVHATFRRYGGDHRIFDGNHDPIGAWKAIAEAMPGEAWTQRATGYLSALWKDAATPNGLPLATWNKETFDTVAGSLNKTLGISPAWTKDMVTVTATEAVGSVLATATLVLNWNDADLRRFSGTVGSLGLAALVGANPLGVAVAIVGLAKCFHEVRHGADFKRFASGTGRGTAAVAATIGASRLIPAPAWPALMLGVASYVAATKLYDKAEPEAEKVARVVRDWLESREWADFRSGLARSAYLRGRTVARSVADSELANAVSAWSRASSEAVARAWSAGYRNSIRAAGEALARGQPAFG